MVDKLTTKELDEIYKRIERVIDTRKVTQQKILNWLVAPRKMFKAKKSYPIPESSGINDLARLLHGLRTVHIEKYIREGKSVSGYIRTSTIWSLPEERFILENLDMPLMMMAKRLGKTYHAVRTKKRRLLVKLRK